MQKAPGRDSVMLLRGEAVPKTARADHVTDRSVGPASRTWDSMAAMRSSPATKFCVAYDAAGCVAAAGSAAHLGPVAGAALSKASTGSFPFGLTHLHKHEHQDLKVFVSGGRLQRGRVLESFVYRGSGPGGCRRAGGCAR